MNRGRKSITINENRFQENRSSLLHVEELFKSLTSIVGLNQLLENFSARLREMFAASAVYIVLHEPVTDRYVGKIAKGTNTGLLTGFNFSRSDNLIKWLNVNRCVLDVTSSDQVMAFLSRHEQDLLRRSGIHFIAPLIVMNRLTGIILLAGRTNGNPYGREDVGMITTLASQSALAIEHAVMVQF